MATHHNFRIKNGLEVGGVLIVNSSGQLVVADVNSNQKFLDNVRLRFGDDSDYQIFHSNNGVTYLAGSTVEHSSNTWRVMNLAGTEAIIKGNADGNVELFHNGGSRFKTTTAGVQIPSAGTTIGWSNLANAWLLLGTSSAGIGIDNNEIMAKGVGSLYLGTGDSGADVIIRAGGTSARMTIAASDGEVTIPGDLSVGGDLNITGDINSISVTDLDVADKTITLGRGQTEGNSGGSGIVIDGSLAELKWDEGDNQWEFNKNVYTTGFINAAAGISEFATAKVNAGGLRVYGGGTYSDPGQQMYLHADSSGYGRLAVHDMRFLVGANSSRTIEALRLTSTGGVHLKDNAVLQWGNSSHSIQSGASHSGGDMTLTSSDDMWFRTRWARFQDIVGSAGEYARISYNGSWIYSTLTSRHIKPQTDSSYNLGEVNKRYSTIFGDTGRFETLDIDGNVDVDGTIETDGLTVNNNPVYIRDREGASVAGAGYYRVAENTVGGAGRGAFICTVYTTGGSYAPKEVVIQGHTDWSSTETIHTVKSSAGNTYFTKARIVRESGDAFLEVYFYGAITDLEIEVVAVGHAGWVAKTGTLTAATGTETRVGPEVLIAPGLNTQDVVNATQGFQVNNQTIVDNSRNIENITSITTEGTAASGAIVDMRPSDTNQMFRVRFPDSSTMEMGTTRAGSGNIQKAVVYGQGGVDISTNGILRASMTQAGDLSLDADCGGLYFGGSTRSTTTNAQTYIKESGLNLDIKGNDNVRLLGDGGNVILHADYTGKVSVGNGVTAGASILHVKGTQSYGSLRISPSSANGESAMAFFLDTAGTQTSNAWVVGHAGWGNTGDFVIGNQAFGGPVMLMQQDGKVGIGTLTPGSILDVKGANGAAGIRLTSPSGLGSALNIDSSGYGEFYLYQAGGNPKVGLLANGNSYLLGGGITVGHSVAAGISGNPADLNYAEVGPGFIRVNRDDTADAAQLSFGKNGAVHSYLETRTNGLGFITNVGNFAFEGGDVGIGTASPNSYTNQRGLTINGTTHSRVDLEVGGVLKGNIHADSGSINVDAGANKVRFYAGNTERARISSTGRLHVNHTNDPGWDSLGTLVVRQVADNTGIGIVDDASQNTLQLRNNGSYSEFYYNVNNPIVISQAGGERFRFDSDGNILFQNGSPEFHFGTTSASHYNWRVAAQEVVNNGFEIASGTQSAGSGAASDSYNTRFVIQGDTGNVGIGTNSPNDGKLQISANSSSDWGTYIYNTNASGMGLHVESNASSTTEVLRVSSVANSGSNYVTFKVLASGRVGINKGTAGLSADGLHIGTINNNCELDMEHTGSSGKRYRFNSLSTGAFLLQNKTDNITVFTVNGSSNETDFTSPITTAGYKLTANTNLYGTDATISMHSSSNAVYVNGAGNSGWLRLNAAGASNDRCAINLFGASAGDNITMRTNSTTRIGVLSGGNVAIGSHTPDATLHVDGAVILGGNENKATTPIAGVHIVDDSYSQWHQTLGPRAGTLRVESYWKGNNAHDRAIGDYGGGIVFNILGGHSTTHDDNMHGWIGPRVWDTPGRERAALVFATNNDTSTQPSESTATILERMCITPAGLVGIANKNPGYLLEVGDASQTNSNIFSGRVNGDFIFNLSKASTNLFSIRNNNTGIVHLNTQNSATLALGVSTATSTGTIIQDMTIGTGAVQVNKHFKAQASSGWHVGPSAGQGFHERYFVSSYAPHNTANQMYKLNLGNTGALNGVLEITVQGTYSHQDVSGYVKRTTNIGLNANGSIWRNDLISIEQSGKAADSIVIGPVQWDSSASQYYVNIYKITSTGNAFTVGVKLWTASSTDGNFANFTLSNHATLAAPTGYTSRYDTNARPQNVNRQRITDTSTEAFRVDGHAHAAEYNLPSGGMLDWANGDARIIEGQGENYSLSLQTYDGSNVTTNTRFDGDNSVHHFGSEFSFLNNKIDMHSNSTPNGLSAVPTMRIGDFSRGTEELQFNVSSNGTARICFKDNNWSEGTYIKSKGETHGGKIYFGAMWDDEEDKIVMDLRQSSAGASYDARMGINTTGPDYTLDVNGDVGINEYIYHNGDSNTYWRFQSDRIDIRAGGSDTITVKPTQLDINQSAKYSGFSTAGAQNRDQAIYIGRDQTDTSTEYFTMGWKSTARSGEQMQPTNGPYNGGAAFYIEAGSTEAGGICLDQDSVNVYGSSDSGSTFRVIDKDSDIVTFEMKQTTWEGVFRGNVTAFGSMSSISDKRIKENIEPIEPVIEKIKNVGVYKYNKITAPKAYKDRKEIGVIAQELQEEFPDLVNEETVDPEKTYGLDTILSVDYEHLTAVLLKGMQEQQDQIDSMKKQIEELTSKLNGE